MAKNTGTGSRVGIIRNRICTKTEIPLKGGETATVYVITDTDGKQIRTQGSKPKSVPVRK